MVVLCQCKLLTGLKIELHLFCPLHESALSGLGDDQVYNIILLYHGLAQFMLVVLQMHCMQGANDVRISKIGW